MASTAPASTRLPTLVWDGIITHLSDSLETLLDLASLDPSLKELCRPAISSHFRKVVMPKLPLSSTHYYHALLHLILQGYIDPTAILELHHPDHLSTLRPCSPSGLPPSRPGLRDPSSAQVRAYDQRYQEALHANPYIPVDLHDEIVTRYQRGEYDAALVVLLPMCTKLKVLAPPVRSELCAALFKSISQAYTKLDISPETHRAFAYQTLQTDLAAEKQGKPPRKAYAGHDLPFSELLIICTSGDMYGNGLHLHQHLPFMTLPSLHRIILTHIRDRQYPLQPNRHRKPPPVPANTICNCPTIYFTESSVSPSAAMAFAEAHLAPGSEIIQWFERDVEGWQGESELHATWDHVLVKTGDGGKKVLEKRLDWQGGNPGYDYAWVSRLFHDTMADWRRLGEEFNLREEDEHEEWLSGTFG